MWRKGPMAQRSLLASVERHDPVTGEWRTLRGIKHFQEGRFYAAVACDV